MLPPTKQMVLNVEYNLSPVSVPTASGFEILLVGFIDYTVVVTHDVKIASELRYLLVSFSFLAKYRILFEPPWRAESCTVHSVGVGIFCCRSEGSGREA